MADNDESVRRNVKDSSKESKYVIFRLGDEEFGVDIAQVNRIIRMDTITRIPNTPDYIMGVLNLRGGIVVIVDLAKKLGFPSKDSDPNTRIIDVEIGGAVIGMVVDSAKELLTISDKNIQPPPELILKKINAEYVKGVAIIEERVLIILDLRKVLDFEEIKNISVISEINKKSNGSKPNNESEEDSE